MHFRSRLSYRPQELARVYSFIPSASPDVLPGYQRGLDVRTLHVGRISFGTLRTFLRSISKPLLQVNSRMNNREATPSGRSTVAPIDPCSLNGHNMQSTFSRMYCPSVYIPYFSRLQDTYGLDSRRLSH